MSLYVYMHPDHGFLHYDRFVKLDDSDSELEDLKEFLGPALQGMATMLSIFCRSHWERHLHQVCVR